jgi:hypothetical protein
MTGDRSQSTLSGRTDTAYPADDGDYCVECDRRVSAAVVVVNDATGDHAGYCRNHGPAWALAEVADD